MKRYSCLSGSWYLVVSLFALPGLGAAVAQDAEVLIIDHDIPVTNHPPSVEISMPRNGAVFAAPGLILITASPFDPDGFVGTVEFFQGTNSLGITTNNPEIVGPLNPFMVTWSNVPPGFYELTAKATDDKGAMGASPPVRVAVVDTNSVLQPIVNLYAIDDRGSEVPVVPPWLYLAQWSDPASFLLTRTGPTNLPLTVFYGVGGTASNGVDYIYGGWNDYQGLPGNVTIPAGASSATIVVWVVDDFEVEGTETVELTLQPPPVWPCLLSNPPCLLSPIAPPYYVIGPSNQAVAKILDNDLAPAPVVTVVASDPDAAERGLDTGTFTVSRTGDTSTPLGVFYSVGGTAEEGVDYLPLPDPGFYRIFTGFHFLEIPAGARSADLVVTPIDDPLAEGSETVVLQLRPQPWWPVVVGAPSNAVVTIADNETGTNQPPFVQLIAPRDDEVFTAPADIRLVAFGQDAEDHYSLKVEFFEEAHSLGFGTFNPTRCWPGCPNYVLTWSNVPPGRYILTARAMDNGGASSVSDPVHILVVESNRAPAVNIVARDPFASEGTNFWLRDGEADRWAIDIWNLWHVNIGGTNTATFVVRRHDPATADLTVDYDIGGTASNGVDYVALPGSVTIPADHHTARIVVMPIEDSLAEGIETIVLRLRASPDYAVGLPSQAAAILIDNDRPRPPCVRLRDGLFNLCVPATNGFCFRVEASADLRHWTQLCTNVVTEGALHFVDPDAQPLDTRFYRAQPEPGLPPDD